MVCHNFLIAREVTLLYILFEALVFKGTLGYREPCHAMESNAQYLQVLIYIEISCFFGGLFKGYLFKDTNLKGLSPIRLTLP